MRQTFIASLLISSTLIFGGCGRTAAPSDNAASNANQAQAPSLKDELFALEKKTHEALKNKDAAYMNEMVPENFLGFVGQKLATKKEVLAWFSNPECAIKSQTLSDEQVTEISPNAALLTFKTTTDGMCGERPWPANTWAVTLYVKKDGKWRPNYHQEAVIADPNASVPAKPTAVNEAELMPPAMNDPLTTALKKLEIGFWDAVKNGDKKYMEDNLASTFVQLGSGGRSGRADLIKVVEDKTCKIDSYSFSNEVSSRINDNIAIFAFAAKEKASCGGQAAPDNIHAADIYVMHPDGKWKSTFYMESPVK